MFENILDKYYVCKSTWEILCLRASNYYLEEAWWLAIAKGLSYKLNMMAFANKIQNQTQLSLKLGYYLSDQKHNCIVKLSSICVINHRKETFMKDQKNTFLASLGGLRTFSTSSQRGLCKLYCHHFKTWLSSWSLYK